jgi:hypothetical protein
MINISFFLAILLLCQKLDRNAFHENGKNQYQKIMISNTGILFYAEENPFQLLKSIEKSQRNNAIEQSTVHFL